MQLMAVCDANGTAAATGHVPTRRRRLTLAGTLAWLLACQTRSLCRDALMAEHKLLMSR